MAIEMNCRKATGCMGPFIDGELPISQAKEVGSHLAGCPACSLRHRRMQAMLRELSALPAISPSTEEREQLLRRVRSEMSDVAPLPSFRRRAQMAAAAISLLAVAAAGVVLTVWAGERAPVVEEAAPGEQPGVEASWEKGSGESNARAGVSAAPETPLPPLSLAPSLVVSGREYDPEGLKYYREDLGARLDFYSAYWYPASVGALDEETLRREQRELTDELAAMAASRGSDPESLKAAVEAALARAGGETLLPCHAELAKVNGRECWLVSLSGPEDYLLFPDPQQPPAMVLASLGGEESLKVSESLLRELAAALAPLYGAIPPAPTSFSWKEKESSLEGNAPAETVQAGKDSGGSGGKTTDAGEVRNDFQSFLRQLAARYNSLDMLGKLESLEYEQVLMLLRGDWAGLAAEGVNLGDFVRPPRRLTAVDRESGTILW